MPARPSWILSGHSTNEIKGHNQPRNKPTFSRKELPDKEQPDGSELCLLWQWLSTAGCQSTGLDDFLSTFTDLILSQVTDSLCQGDRADGEGKRLASRQAVHLDYSNSNAYSFQFLKAFNLCLKFANCAAEAAVSPKRQSSKNVHHVTYYWSGP